MRVFELEILTPEEKIFSGLVSSLSAKALDGQIGVLAGHAPLATVLSKGDVFFTPQGGAKRSIAASEGFLIVANNRASVLLS